MRYLINSNIQVVCVSVVTVLCKHDTTEILYRVYVNGIVARALNICFWYHSIDLELLPLTECVCLLFKFLFF
jgi:hypothetical protein